MYHLLFVLTLARLSLHFLKYGSTLERKVIDIKTKCRHAKLFPSSAVEVDEIRKFKVETKAVSEFEIPCKVTATTPKGQTMFLPANKVPEGYECTFAPKEEGPHKIKVEYAGHEVPKSPVNVKVEPKLDMKKIKVDGLDKRKCIVCVPNLLLCELPFVQSSIKLQNI